MQNIAVLGAGSWGTAIAVHLAKKGYNIKVWGIDKDKVDKINFEKENNEYLPNIQLPSNVLFTTDLEDSIVNSQIIVLAAPSHAIREICTQIKDYIGNQVIVNLAKGIENGTLLRMSEVVSQTLPNNDVVALYGPSHAEEVAKEIPTTVVSACKNMSTAELVQDIFMTERFRVYTNSDMVGAEIGGSIKNVIALCAGISDGLGFGDNTKAALMTRGLNEIKKLGIALGAAPYTFAGLTGIGDLIVTCTSMHSRNRRFGILLGQGRNFDEALKEIHMVVEGVKTTESAYHLAKKYNISMPITEQAYEVLFNNKNPREAVTELMLRDRKSEGQ